MRILLVNPRGFCAGVEMAIEVVEQVLEALAEVGASESVYVYHEIVHNKHVVGRFRHRGVVFVESIDAIPEGSVVVFSAHGISPEVRAAARERNLTAIDATCPLVTKVHAEAIRYSRQGYQILLVGHRDHQEVVGTRGEAPDAIQVVESPDDIPALRIDDPDKLVYLTQTTLSTDDAGVIIDALKAAFPNIKEPPSSDICYATTNRQHAVRTFAPRADLVLVIGSQNSSNSVRLTEIAQNVGTPGRRVDDASELRDEWFEGVETVLVTAGASAPEDLVAGVCRTLIETFGGEIEIVSTVDEDQEFNLPASLRRWKSDRGLDGANERMRIGHYDYSVEMYGAVPLTVSAKR
jgi:4-hydroxy-3-methylbut-2-enyl diphosphate reductase